MAPPQEVDSKYRDSLIDLLVKNFIDLGLGGRYRDVFIIAKRMFEAYDLNYGFSEAQEWGKLYFKDSGCEETIRQAAEKDSMEFVRLSYNLEIW
jgi:hypothetical protein